MNDCEAHSERDLRALENGRPNITVRTVDASHMLVWDIPDQVVSHLLAFTEGPRASDCRRRRGPRTE